MRRSLCPCKLSISERKYQQADIYIRTHVFSCLFLPCQLIKTGDIIAQYLVCLRQAVQAYYDLHILFMSNNNMKVSYYHFYLPKIDSTDTHIDTQTRFIGQIKPIRKHGYFGRSVISQESKDDTNQTHCTWRNSMLQTCYNKRIILSPISPVERSAIEIFYRSTLSTL